MTFDLEHDGELPPGADVLIVGAGAAGITLAVELSKRGQDVLLLEGGGAQDESSSQELYRSEVIGLPHTGIHEGRFRVNGGTTTRWGGQILELFEDDFRARPWIAGSGWPIAKDELSPYYERALVSEGLQEVLRHDIEAWRRVGVEKPALGPSLHPFLSRWCRQANFALLHRGALTSRPNLNVVLHANACELILKEDGRSVAGVRCRTLSGREKIFKASQVVLCLGGIETSRFLLQPRGQGPAPWQENGLLGRHFQDHLDVYCADVEDIEPRRFHDYFDHVCRGGFRYEPRFRLTDDVQREAGILNVAGMVFFEDPADAPRHRVWQTMKLLIKGRLRQVSAGDLRTLVANFPQLARQMYRYQVHGRSYNPGSIVKFKLRAFCEQEPLGESQVTLSDEKDALGLRRARLDWRISELEIASVRRFVEVVGAALAASGLARVRPDPDLLHDPAKFTTKVMDSFHHMGGARLAAAANEGVVDPQLKVHGTENLCCCSSAVFPTSGFSNPTHTLLALAIRLADHLIAKAPPFLGQNGTAPSPVTDRRALAPENAPAALSSRQR